MAKHYHAKVGAVGCYVITGHNMAIHLFDRSTSREGAEEIAELLDQAYELGLIRGVNGHPDALAATAPKAERASADGADGTDGAQARGNATQPKTWYCARTAEQVPYPCHYNESGVDCKCTH